jgi:formiminotetrahydrofolate cyclodeaminase
MEAAFLKDLARPQPDPGGGAAAAFGALVGLALMEKVGRLELKRRSASIENAAFWQRLLKQVGSLTAALTALGDGDVKAYQELTAARVSGAKGEPWIAAITNAIGCPREIMHQTNDALNCLCPMAERCQRHLVADLQVACELLGAAFRGAFHIAGANLQLVDQKSRRESCRLGLETSLQQGLASLALARERLAARQSQ